MNHDKYKALLVRQDAQRQRRNKTEEELHLAKLLRRHGIKPVKTKIPVGDYIACIGIANRNLLIDVVEDGECPKFGRWRCKSFGFNYLYFEASEIIYEPEQVIAEIMQYNPHPLNAYKFKMNGRAAKQEVFKI